MSNFSSKNEFKKPIKAIHTVTDFENFLKSPVYHEILDFIKESADAVVGKKKNYIVEKDSCEITSSGVVLSKFIELMDIGIALVDEVPPIKQPMRFGNKAFRQWHERMMTEVDTFLSCILLPVELNEAAVELKPYIEDMFGNITRLDYGTGHELNFALFFLCLKKLGLIQSSDLEFIVVNGFSHYVRTMRRLQVDYMLEPAGSHGVWGLDDYHCLLFLWGSAQLSGQNESTPSSIHDNQLLRENKDDYLYFEGIHFIKTIKKGAPFAETSPMLNDISDMHEWAKICSGLMRLFQGEILNKFQVIQHTWFGSLLKYTWEVSPTSTIEPTAAATKEVNPNPFINNNNPSFATNMTSATAAPWASTNAGAGNGSITSTIPGFGVGAGMNMLATVRPTGVPGSHAYNSNSVYNHVSNYKHAPSAGAASFTYEHGGGGSKK